MLKAIPLAALAVSSTGRRGQETAAKIVKVLDSFKVPAKSVMSVVFDGAYIHEGVGQRLKTELGDQLHVAYDAMHKGNRVEVNLLKADHGFVKETTDTILEVNKLLGYGKNLALAKEISSELGFLLLQMNRLPDTRMANYKGTVLIKFFRSYQAIRATLVRLESTLTNSSRDKKTKETVSKLLQEISGSRFLKNLCALLDIYKIAGQIQQIVQIVNILPHVKYDKFKSLTNHLDEMSQDLSRDHCDCTVLERARSSSRSSSRSRSPSLRRTIQSRSLSKGIQSRCPAVSVSPGVSRSRSQLSAVSHAPRVSRSRNRSESSKDMQSRSTTVSRPRSRSSAVSRSWSISESSENMQSRSTAVSRSTSISESEVMKSRSPAFSRSRSLSKDIQSRSPDVSVAPRVIRSRSLSKDMQSEDMQLRPFAVSAVQGDTRSSSPSISSGNMRSLSRSLSTSTSMSGSHVTSRTISHNAGRLFRFLF